MNDLYRGTFVFTKGIQPRIIYRPGASPKHAWVRMCNAFAKEDDVDPSVVMRRFDWDKCQGVNFEIKVEMQYKEEDE